MYIIFNDWFIPLPLALANPTLSMVNKKLKFFKKILFYCNILETVTCLNIRFLAATTKTRNLLK